MPEENWETSAHVKRPDSPCCFPSLFSITVSATDLYNAMYQPKGRCVSVNGTTTDGTQFRAAIEGMTKEEATQMILELQALMLSKMPQLIPQLPASPPVTVFQKLQALAQRQEVQEYGFQCMTLEVFPDGSGNLWATDTFGDREGPAVAFNAEAEFLALLDTNTAGRQPQE